MDFIDDDAFPAPRYWDLLSDVDKNDYKRMRATLSSPSCKNRRNHSIETFREVIGTIHAYVFKSEEDQWQRALAAGMVWLADSIAINTHQLRLLTSKCKSSINGSFQALGYSTIPSGAESCSELIDRYSFMKNNFSELRQWTIRKNQNMSEPPKKVAEFIPKIKLNLKKHSRQSCSSLPSVTRTQSHSALQEMDEEEEKNVCNTCQEPLSMEQDPLALLSQCWFDSPFDEEKSIIEELFANKY